MPSFDVTNNRPRINIFKISGAYYFKYFFEDPEIFRELESFYDKSRYRFKMATAGERNKVMKVLDLKGYDPTIIDDPAPYTVEIGKYQKYGELLKNSVDNYPLREKIIFIMKDIACVEQALAMGAVAKSLEEGQEAINRTAKKEKPKEKPKSKM
jgi:hypothetical protein